MKKMVYFFGEGNATMKDLLGGKGANLAEMTNIGLPVPAGFTITTEVCIDYQKSKKWPAGLKEQVDENMLKLEKKMNKKFGSVDNPLLLSVRSGAKFSMPGMMNTVLNLGLNDETVRGLAKLTNNERFAYDCYRRFLQMFGDVVLKVEHEEFEHILESVKKGRKDTDLTAEELKLVSEKYKKLIKERTGSDFPADPKKQLEMSINAVFGSWNTKRAVTYRELNKISHDLGTAVNVQVMVYGNMGNDSATGVAFTRNPSTGVKEYYGEYLVNAQGEDVVAGIRTPKPITEMEKELPAMFEELKKIYKILDTHYRDMQDFEFTVEKGKLYMLQTRVGKRTIQSAVKIAVDMVNEGLINKKEAVSRIDPYQVDKLLHRRIDPSAKKTLLGKGLPASPGAATGEVVFDSDDAVERAEAGKKVILVRLETTPDDIHGMHASQGILTSRGGMTSHAAVVARGMGTPCVAGCGDIKIDMATKTFTASGHVIKEGDVIAIDGGSGEIYLGKVPTIEPELSADFNKILAWADEIRRLGVRTNADTPRDAKKAREFGAEGIGLCRTEHMFFAEDRLPIVQKMIMAETKEEREAELAKLLPMQERDFIEIFEVMDGLPVTIRLIDPPLHEFLPNMETLVRETTELRCRGNVKELAEKEMLLSKVKSLHETNPMLGLRGCRLGIVYPEIFDMQVRAIMKAAVVVKKNGIDVKPEIMIPLVGHVNELKVTREQAERIVKEILEESDMNIKYMIGTMIELPRACMIAAEISELAEFFSFGTNDLTQTTFGYSRDDAEAKFLGPYIENKILKESPFMVLDQDGVGKLMKIAIDAVKGKKIKLGICGEHGGDPESVKFCDKLGLDYVSCSPFRVPIARLSAAQAAVGRSESSSV